ncbi:hypothetical protein, partial [Stenotrophomonas maltophilia]|uniref:hypothetical protein n=1 Tax=Stenotrophomonas maltophilia TaxID=40324 RepID=UPI001C608112
MAWIYPIERAAVVLAVDPRHAWMEDPQKSPGICMPGLLHPRMAWILSLANLAPWVPRARRGRPC